MRYRSTFLPASRQLLGCLLFLLCLGGSGALYAQCVPGFAHMQGFTIANANAGALNNFQVKVTVNTQALITAGKMQSTGADIRFTDSLCNNLPYWIENQTINTAATAIWVKVNSLPAAGAKNIYMHYGNSSATAASSGSATFEMFDDFNDLSSWTQCVSASWGVTTSPPAGAGSGSFAHPVISGCGNSSGLGIFHSGYLAADGIIESRIYNTNNSACYNGGFSIYGRVTGCNNGAYKFNSGGYSNAYSIGTTTTLTTNNWTVLAVTGSHISHATAGFARFRTTLNGTALGLSIDEGPLAPTSLSATSSSFNGMGNVGIGSWQNAYVDWIFVRKLATSDPVVTVLSNTITTGTIAPTSFCAGTILNVPFSATGTIYSGNVYTAQLSDATGSFGFPVAIGTLATTAVLGTISATIPAATTSGNGYRIRVISSAPGAYGADNGTALTIGNSNSALYVDGGVAASGNGLSWATAYKSVTEALTNANTNVCYKEIWVKAGTYYPTTAAGATTTSRDSAFRISRNGIRLYGGFNGTETALAQRNYTTNVTILSGDLGTPNDSTDNAYHVMTIAGESGSPVDTTTIVDGFTITRGNANLANSFMNLGTTYAYRMDGGGINLAGANNGNSSPKLENLIITRNTAINGGGLYSAAHSDGQSSPLIRSCTFSENRATGSGGGYYAYCSGTTPEISPSVYSSTFSNNIAAASGGAVSLLTNATTGGKNHAIFSGCAFTGNAFTTATGFGSAAYIIGNDSTNPNFVNCTINGNTANYGGIYAEACAGINVTGSTFSNNTGTSYSGAFVANNSTSFITGSSFTDNTTLNGTATTYGGAMTFTGASRKRVHTITGCTFTNNYSYALGGGIFAADSAHVVLINDTTYSNEAGQGGGFLHLNNSAALTATNCVFDKDSAGNWGGVIRHLSNNAGTITNCRFENAYASVSGGVIDHNHASSVYNWTGCVFYNNKVSSTAGGAVHCFAGKDTLLHCVFSNNNVTTGTLGGALSVYTNQGSVTAIHSTFSNNPATSGKSNFYVASGATLRLINSVGSSTSGSMITGTATLFNSLVKGMTGLSAPNLNADPVFINPSLPMGADGVWGTTDDGLELAPCSPAVNAGSNALIPAGVSTDFAGAARIQQGTVDMGAYEQASANGTRIYVNGTVPVSGNGFSWAGAFRTLTEALMVSNSGCSDTIWVAAGTYYPTTATGAATTSRDSSFRIIRNGVKVFGGFNGTETALTQRNITTNATILSGDLGTTNDTSDNAYHVFQIVPFGGSGIIDSNTILDGLTMTRGNAYNASGSFSLNGFTTGHQDGGGLYLYGASTSTNSPRILSCTFTGNYATYGAGMYVNGPSSTATVRPTISGCTFSNNIASQSGGGLLHFGAAYSVKSTVTNCSFTGNTASMLGGGFYASSAGSTLSSCAFTGNSSLIGGAAYFTTDSITISNSSFNNNKAGSNGGAIYQNATVFTGSGLSFTNDTALNGGGVFQNGGKASYVNSTFSTNGTTSTGNGAGIYSGGTNGTYTNCAFTANATSGHGSAVYGINDTANYSACTFTGNNGNAITQGDGGAIASLGNALLTVSGCTFTGNTGTLDRGEAIGTSGYATITGSTFTGNVAGTGGAIGITSGGKTVSVSNCKFTNNGTVGSLGGVVVIIGSTNLTVSNSSFTGNYANGSNGGGVLYAQGGGTITFNTDTFTSNRSATIGGVYTVLGSNGVFSNCIFKDNKSSGNGGAIYSQTGTLILTGSVFERDSATTANGGALYVLNSTRFLANRNFFRDNYSSGFGAGVAVLTSNDTLVNNVFTGNRGGSTGGGALAVSTTTGNISLVTNNTFHANSTTGTGAVWLSGTAGTQGVYNNIFRSNITGSGTADIYNNTAGATVTSTNNFTGIDPLFLNAASPIGADNLWGTSDDGLQLTSCSQAINTGINAPVTNFATDAINGVRIQQTTVDPGAYESPYLNTAVLPAVTIVANPAGAICAGTSVTFTATPTNGGSTPAYQWLVNGIPSGTGATYTSTTLSNSAVVQVKLISNATCRIVDTVSSNTITMTVNPVPVISGTLLADPTTCGGTDGSIYLTGLAPSSTYTVSYTLNSTVQTASLTSSATGVIQIATLGAGSYTSLSATRLNCTSNIIAGPLVLNAPPTPLISTVTGISPTTCNGTNGSLSLNGLLPGGVYNVTYTKNAAAPTTGSFTAAANGSISITGLGQGSYTAFSVNRLNCQSNTVAGPIVLTDPMTPAAPVVTSNTPVCQGATLALTATGQSGATYSWTGPNTYSSAVQNPSLSNMQAVNAGTYSVTQTVSGCVSPAATTAVTMNTIPATPGAITGNTTPCSGTTGTYSISAVPNAISYVWTIPATAGWSTTGSTISSINVTAGNAAGSVTVAAVNGCGTSPAATLALTPGSIPAQPGAITGPANLCSGSTGTYSITAVPNATTYTWSMPAGWNWTTPTSTSVSSIAIAPGGTISVAATNSCGSSTASSMTVSVVSIPAQPGTITGTATPCINSAQTYSITAVSGATSYIWSLPSGGTPAWAGTSTGTSIPATVGTYSGNVSVYATNQCGTSLPATLPITVTQLPTQPGAISGITVPCVGSPVTYTLTSPSVGATSYTWSYPATWTGSTGTTTATATPGSGSGMITVTPVGVCGNGTPVSIAVAPTAVVTPTVLLTRSTPTDTICNGTTVTFTATSTGGGIAPQYVFRKNGNVVVSGNTVYVTNTLANTDVISVTMTSSLPCVSQAQVKDSIRMYVKPLVTPVVSINALPSAIVCKGTAVSFQSVSSGTGTTPLYQWYKNSSPVPGATGTTYNPASLQNSDTIMLSMTTSAECPAFSIGYSNKVVMTISDTITPSVTITVNPTVFVPGNPMNFSTSTVGAGTGATYQWYRNGLAIAGATGATYSSSSLSQGDQIQVRLYSTLPCATVPMVLSNTLVMKGESTGVPTVPGNWNGAVTLYPNPNRGDFTIRGDWDAAHAGKMLRVIVHNVVGQQAYGARLWPTTGTWEHTVNLSQELANGTYVLSLESEDGMRYVTRFVLNR